MASNPVIIIKGGDLKENLNFINNKLSKSKNKNIERLILQSSSRQNNLKLCYIALYLLYNREWKEGRFKIYNARGRANFRILLSKNKSKIKIE